MPTRFARWIAAAPIAALAAHPHAAGAQSIPVAERATADALAPARAYVRSSMSFAGSGGLYTGESRTSGPATSFQVGGVTRFVHRGLVIECSASGSYGDQSYRDLSTGQSTTYRFGTVGLGVAVGYAVALGEAVAVTPTVRYQAVLRASEVQGATSHEWMTGFDHDVSARLPVTLFLTRHVWLEPYVEIGYLTGSEGHFFGASAGWSVGITI